VNIKDNIPKPQGAHEAIRPVLITTRSLTLDSSTSDLQAKAVRLYDLIWTRSIESCMPSAQYTSITATINLTQSDVKDEKYKDYHFACKAEQVVFPGWQIVTMKPNISESKEDRSYNYFTHLKQGITLNYKKIEAKTLLKDLKSHYTEARLVQLLEEKGIGRPSTFASIIDKLIERKYVEKQNVEGKQVECIDFVLDDTNKILETVSKKEFGNEKGKLVIQPLGVIVIEFLLKHFPTFFEYSYTKDMEDDLDKIASGQGKWTSVCSTCHNDLIRIIDNLKDLKKFEIRIDNEYSIIIGKYGPVIKFTESNETKKEKDKIKKNTTFIPVKKGLDIKLLLDFEETNGRQLTLDDVMDKAKSNQDSIGRKTEPTYSVYVIEIEKLDPSLKFDFYVGSTGNPIPYRFSQHIPDHKFAARMFKNSRARATRIRWDLIFDFPKFHTKGAAEKAEGLLARAIQKAGWTVSSDRLDKD
jgi:DNA topoisomerase-1